MDTNNTPEVKPSETHPSGTATFTLPNPAGMWERYGDIVKKITRAVSGVGLLGLLALIIFTCLDVLGSKLFNLPFPGYTGITQLCQLVAMTFAMGITYLAGSHITIELLKGRLPRRVEAGMYSFVHLLGLALFVLLIWRIFVMSRAFQLSGEVVDQIRIPLYPFAYALIIAMLPVALLLLYNLGNSLRGMVKK